MKYCIHCGHEIPDDAKHCPDCGGSQGMYPEVNSPAPVVDNGSVGWSFLGCCLPVVGLILFLVWQDTRPKSAKMAGIGALVCVIGIAAFYVLFFLLGIGISLLRLSIAF